MLKPLTLYCAQTRQNETSVNSFEIPSNHFIDRKGADSVIFPVSLASEESVRGVWGVRLVVYTRGV